MLLIAVTFVLRAAPPMVTETWQWTRMLSQEKKRMSRHTAWFSLLPERFCKIPSIKQRCPTRNMGALSLSKTKIEMDLSETINMHSHYNTCKRETCNFVFGFVSVLNKVCFPNV